MGFKQLKNLLSDLMSILMEELQRDLLMRYYSREKQILIGR